MADVKKYDFNETVEDPLKKMVLIIYDIMDNKRRLKMVRALESYGNRVQRSAFEALLNKQQQHELVSRIECIIDEEDNVRIYRLNSSNEVLLLGTTESIYEEDVVIL